MNIKMTTNSQLSTTESKTNNANNQNRNRIINTEIIWRLSAGSRKGKKRGKIRGLRITIDM